MPFVVAKPKIHLVRDGRLREGPHLARARTQAAVVRTLMDVVERPESASAEDEVKAQLREELLRLRSQLRETMSKLAGARED